ncbi:MAG TPA: ABC transporter ATP-binding protein [Accumulibacter sp.]|nr:ABC transporter ATP-binding protein [Accumulibacter sp.]HMW16749.1 ABC transporter ATP-binding protein [Accumulibacter sp.]HMX23679.1 ABC transporter ATP-binding protein [Accumulibacter sp.]HMY07692.1 ABC transporter ATP-binding protein [Accumulibacter sp.]HNC18236.1 ABC transporter ATP-binding protein [Accumulibacter sp.]
MPAAVAIDHVEKRFGALQALDGVSLRIEPGEFFGLLGPNGAGKTTLISCLAGLVRPDRGHLLVQGHDVVNDYRAARRLLGVVPQELVFDPFFSVRETLRIQSGYFGIRHNDDWIDEILANLDLTAKADTNMRRLSGGMKRRVLVAQALVHKPPVIVLDEPTAGVDVELRQGLWQFIRRLNDNGHTVILTTHYLEEAETLCGRIAMLKQGRVVALDTTRNLLARFSGQTLRFRLANPDRLPVTLLQRATSNGGDTWNVPLAHLNEIEGVLAALRQAECPIDDLRLTQTDLEDVFLGVMQAADSAQEIRR